MFDCDCFDCYQLWDRCDSSPNHKLIYQVIQAFEDNLFHDKNRKEKNGHPKAPKLANVSILPRNASPEKVEPEMVSLRRRMMGVRETTVKEMLLRRGRRTCLAGRVGVFEFSFMEPLESKCLELCFLWEKEKRRYSFYYSCWKN